MARRWLVRMLAATVLALSIGSIPSSPVLASAGAFTYTYDALGRLSSVSYTVGPVNFMTVYSYDAAGNRTLVTTTGSGASVWGSFNWGAGIW